MCVPSTDYRKGFGGKFGVQTDRVDKVGTSILHVNLSVLEVSFVANMVLLDLDITLQSVDLSIKF